MNAIDVSLLCKALGDANRLQIVKLLTQGEMCACKLLEYFQITQPIPPGCCERSRTAFGD